MNSKNYFGIYENFPNTYYCVAVFESRVPLNSLQSAILNAFYNLNHLNTTKNLLETINLGLKIIFEFGVAEGLTFSYLDEKTLRHSMERMRLSIPRIMDFICIIRYYKPVNEMRKTFRALRFDYYLLRLIFGDDALEVRVFHERGLQRIDAENLIKVLAEGVNSELAKKDENPIKLKSLWLSGFQVV